MTYGDNFALFGVGHAWVGFTKHRINPRNKATFLPLQPPCLTLLASLDSVSSNELASKTWCFQPWLPTALSSSFSSSLHPVTATWPFPLPSKPSSVTFHYFPMFHVPLLLQKDLTVCVLLWRWPGWLCSLLYLETSLYDTSVWSSEISGGVLLRNNVYRGGI